MYPEGLGQQYEHRLHEMRCAGKHHPRVQQVLALHKHTRATSRKVCALESLWAHQKALLADVPVETFICCPELIHNVETKELAVAFMDRTHESYRVSAKVFERLVERDKPVGLLSLVTLKTTTLDHVPLRSQNLLVILDGVEIPGNIGTILRTMDGVHADALILCNRRARVTHPKTIRASQGACFFVPIIEVEDGIEPVRHWLKVHDFNIYLADANEGESYYRCQYAARAALVVGSERYGLAPQWYASPHERIHIPMFSAITNSLNVSIAATLILYEIGLRQRGMLQRG